MSSTWYFLVIGSTAGTTWSWRRRQSYADIQIDLWNIHRVANCSSLLADSASISCLPRFLYIWMSSANPSFYDAIEEIAHVRPRCSSVSMVALSWSFWHCNLNSSIFSLVTRSLAFSVTLVISEFEVINCPLSSIQNLDPVSRV
jgi:hypothetical protein